MKLNDFYEYTVATHFSSAIFNDDRSGLDDEEERLLDDFIANLPPAAVTGTWQVQENTDDFDRCEVTDLYSDCVTLSLWFYNPDLAVSLTGDEENLLY